MLEPLEPRQLLTTFLVDSSSGGTGAGTLDSAIAQSNATVPQSTSAPNAIVFSGPMDIVLQQPLPAITEPVIIDGYSAGGSANTTSTSDNAVIPIQVDGSTLAGSPTPAEGLVIQAYDCTVDGLSLTGFTGAAIDIEPPSSPPPTGAIGANVWGDWIGVAPSGTADGNPGAGIVVADSNNVIGGTLPGGRDLIENSGEAGVILCGPGGTGNLVQGSFILHNGGDGVLALSGNNVIGQPVGVLTAGAGDVISGNAGNGVSIRGPSAQGNIVANDLIGVTPDGSGALANQGNGVLIEDSPGNTVGGAESNGMDIIGGNVGEGILIENDQGNALPAVPPSVTQDIQGVSINSPASDATGNLVEGDHIGFNFTQSNVLVLLPNLDGLFVSSAQNTIGGTTTAARNVIVANARDGIAISAAALDSSNGPMSSLANAAPNANVVDGNYIGTQGGADDYGNTLDGIFLDQATADTIGGTVSGAGNVISGNNNGIVLFAPASASPAGGQVVIAGNMIGTMSDGTTPLPNAVAGIVIDGVPSNTIGGTSSGAANVISGNSQGIRIVNAGATGNVVWGNDIGTDLTGTIPVRNAGDGVYLSDCSGNSIGGLASGQANTIAFNTDNGVEVADGGSNLTLDDAILTNAIFANGLLGIVLDGSANQNVAPPSLTDALPDTVLAATQIDGTFTGQPSSTYLLQFFSTPSSTPAGSVEGQTYLGATTVKTDSSGKAIGPVEGSFSADVGTVVAAGNWVTATATLVSLDPTSGQTLRETSTFTPSPIVAINPFLVTTTADVTTTLLPGSLRYAINFSNANPGPSPSQPNTIAFDIPGGGLQTIALVAPLDPITSPVVIDGTTQPGSAVNNSSEDQPPDTLDAQETDVASILVQIDGSQISSSQAIGLDVQAPGCTIDGLSLTGFSGAAIFLEAPSSSSVGSTIRGNLIGVSQFNPRTYNPVNDKANVAANGVGILIDGPNNLIGGASPSDRNIIQGNSGDGVIVYGAQGTGNAIESNFILDNGGDGVLLLSADNHVGMPGLAGLAGSGNLISGNLGNGVHVLDTSARGNSVENNEIGTQLGLAGLPVPILGTAPRPNGGSGVLIENASANTVGGLVAGAANVLAGNGLDGVTIEGPTGSTIPAIVTSPPSTAPLSGQARNVVEGNLIGVNNRNNLVEPIPNGRDGVNVASPGNTIGGTSIQARNIIAANQRDGVTISSDANLVAGNLIGTTTGSDQYGNTAFGILIDGGGANTLGGTAAGAGNVVSGNGTGIGIQGLRAAANLVAGNLVGTTSDGSAPLANAGDGIAINGAPGNTIGGTIAAAANVIGGNTGNGLSLLGTSATGNLVEGNDIGTNAASSTQLGNTLDGILVSGGASNNTIGGTGSGAGNAIAENGGAGVNIQAGSGDSILSNAMWLNAGTGIVIASPAVDQVPPAISAAIPQPGGIQVAGTLTSAAGTTFLIQVFSSNAADAAGSYEGQTLIGSATVTTTAGAGLGLASFSMTIPGDFPIGSAITATATSLASGDTSEFSSDALNAPLVAFSASNYLVSEPAGSATITVVRNSVVGSSSVVYTASAGTAVAGVDFTPVSSAVSFAPGQQTATFSVPLLDTQGRSGQFTINLALADPSGAGLGPPAAATLTITSSPGTLQFASATATVPESSGGITIVVDRVGGASGTVSVDYATSSLGAIPGEDYTPVAGTLTFGPGVTQESFTLPIVATSPNVNDASVQVFLSTPQGGAGIGAPSAETVTIDRPLVVTGERMSASAGGIATVTLTFNKPLNPSQAQDLANFGYYAYWANPRGQFVGGGRTTALAAAAYDPGSLSVTLIPRGALPLNHVYRIAVNGTARAVLSNGLSDALGAPLVGSYGTAGSPYVVTFGAGRRVTYTDSRGHVATLRARHAGLITMFQAIDGAIQQVEMLGATPGRSRMIGSASRGQGGHGRPALSTFAGAASAPIHFGASPLVARRPGWRRH